MTAPDRIPIADPSAEYRVCAWEAEKAVRACA